MAARMPEAPSFQDPESNDKLEDRTRRNKKIGYGVLATVAAVGLAAGGYLFGSSGDGKEVAAQPGNRPTAEAPPAEPSRQPDGDPAATEAVDTAGGQPLTDEEKVENLKQFDDVEYDYIVDGKKYADKHELIDSSLLHISEYPARSDEGRRALAEAFMDLTYDIAINGGLTKEELERFDNGPDSIKLPPHLGMGDHEDIEALQTLTYRSAYESIVGPGLDPELETWLDERSAKQAELFKKTIDNTEPVRAGYEIVDVDTIAELDEQLLGTDKVGLLISFNDSNGFQKEERSAWVLFAPTQDQELWQVEDFDWGQIIAHIKTSRACRSVVENKAKRTVRRILLA